MTNTTNRFAVLYKPAGAGSADLWAVVSDVPADLTRDDVARALQGWSGWPEWAARISIGSTVTVRVMTRGEVNQPAAGELRLTWAELVPPTRTLTVPIPGDLYGEISAAARKRGVSLRVYGAEIVRAGFHATEGSAQDAEVQS